LASRGYRQHARQFRFFDLCQIPFAFRSPPWGEKPDFDRIENRLAPALPPDGGISERARNPPNKIARKLALRFVKALHALRSIQVRYKHMALPQGCLRT